MTEPAVERLRVRSPAFYRGKAAATRARSLAWRVRTRGRAGAPGLRILFYHRVADDRDELAVAPHRFRDQLALLADEGYRVVGVREAGELLQSGPPPDGVIALSFDDGYLDVVENALPELERHGFRATVFLATGVVDGTAHFDWYERQPPVLGWDEVQRLDADGTLEFDAHTVTHPNLLAVDDERARYEIVESKRALEERLRRPVECFCYPAGLFGAREERIVADAGFRWAASCEPGVNTSETDPLALRRVQVDRRDGLLDFRAKLGGGHDRSLALRRSYRSRRYGAKPI